MMERGAPRHVCSPAQILQLFTHSVITYRKYQQMYNDYQSHMLDRYMLWHWCLCTFDPVA